MSTYADWFGRLRCGYFYIRFKRWNLQVSFRRIKKEILEIPHTLAEYPKEWQSFSDAPPTLYAVGDISLLQGRKFAIVGSRRTPAPALKLGAEIAKELSSSLVIVTGTADGGDGAAIEGVLWGSGKVICLLAGGFSALPQNQLDLLEKVAERGLLLSPYAYDTPVRSFSYEHRNKLLAGLSEGVLVLGAAEKSGALITAKYAKAQEKPVFALPYFPGNAAGAGCNALLKQGGILTENALDIAVKIGINLGDKKETRSLTAEEEKVFALLREYTEVHASELAARSGVPIFKLRAILSSLEVKGRAISLGGNRYSPCN